MNEKIVQLDRADAGVAVRNQLTDSEYLEFQEMRTHPATVGHIVFDAESEVIEADNVAESDAAAFANVFDICASLTEPLGQKEHRATVFEGRDMEITCRRMSDLRVVVFRGKGIRKKGD